MGTKPPPAMKDRKRRPNIPKDLNKIEKAACAVLIKDPEISDSDISHQLVKGGYSKDSAYVWKRLNTSETFKLALNNLRDYYSELMVRSCANTAIRNTKKAIKNKDLAATNPSVFLQWNKMVLDKTVGDQRAPDIQTQVNIGQVQAHIQMLVAGKAMQSDNTGDDS